VRWCFLLALAGCATSEPAAMKQAGEGMAGHSARVWSSDVVFRCEPADSEVSLDGVPFGTCLDYSGEPKGLSLSDGMHKVEVKKPGFLPYETYVDAGGTRAALTVKLLPQ
jgi:hypothetical protein